MAKRIRLLSRTAAPCGPASVAEAWQRQERWFLDQYAEATPYLRPGVTAEWIGAYEEVFGQALPEEVKESFRIHDGLPGGIFSGVDFLSLDEARRHWALWQAIYTGDAARSQEGGAIQRSDFHPGWIPLVAEDAVGPQIGIDLDPGPEGIRGQVIAFGWGHDLPAAVLAWSWGWFLTDLVAELERGNFRLVEGSGLCLRDPRGTRFLNAVESWSAAKTGGRAPVVRWTIDPAWLAWQGGTVARLAQSIAAERAFEHLPILGDALEEAGCTDTDILAHCRGSTEHLAGCWLVNSLLGEKTP
jgi:cell wall assembly regulator SMI1